MSPAKSMSTAWGSAHCCERMTQALAHRCEQHPNPYDCPDNLMAYSPKFDEYGLIVHDGGGSYVVIAHCPWCGTKLPDSKRDAWFDRLEAMGFPRPLTEDIPEEFKSDAWWRTETKP